jgi:hypothetical protein
MPQVSFVACKYLLGMMRTQSKHPVSVDDANLTFSTEDTVLKKGHSEPNRSTNVSEQVSASIIKIKVKKKDTNMFSSFILLLKHVISPPALQIFGSFL